MSYPTEESDFAALVRREVEKARAKHPALPTIHHGVSVILEEFIEMQTEAYAQAVNHFKLLKELTHVAATCERMAAELRLTDLVSVNEYTQAYAMAATGAASAGWYYAMLNGWFGYGVASASDADKRISLCHKILDERVTPDKVLVLRTGDTLDVVQGFEREAALVALQHGYKGISYRYRFARVNEKNVPIAVTDPAEVNWPPKEKRED